MNIINKWFRIALLFSIFSCSAIVCNGQTIPSPTITPKSESEILKSLTHPTIAPTVTKTEGLEGKVPADAPSLIGPSGEKYANKKAYDLAEEARKYDMNYGGMENQDREKAVALYQQAMEAQQDAKCNAFIANRIGQLYAFYCNPKIGLKPDPDKAIQWWNRCAELSDPSQLIWSQAQMGLFCTKIVKHDGEAAIKTAEEILSLKPDKIELDNWKYYPSLSKEMVVAQKKYLRDQFIALQTDVVQMHVDLKKRKVHSEKVAKAKETLARQNAFLGGLWSFRFWLVITGATLVLAVLARQGHAWQRNRKVKA